MFSDASVTAGQSSALTERPEKIKNQSRLKGESRQTGITEVEKPAANAGWTRQQKSPRDLKYKTRVSDGMF